VIRWTIVTIAALAGAATIAGCGTAGRAVSRPWEVIVVKSLDTPAKRWVAKVNEDCFYLSNELGKRLTQSLEIQRSSPQLEAGFERAASESARKVDAVLDEVHALAVPHTLRPRLAALDRRWLRVAVEYRTLARQIRVDPAPRSLAGFVRAIKRRENRTADACEPLRAVAKKYRQ
jgi:hypothetical protein